MDTAPVGVVHDRTNRFDHVDLRSRATWNSCVLLEDVPYCGLARVDHGRLVATSTEEVLARVELRIDVDHEHAVHDPPLTSNAPCKVHGERRFSNAALHVC